MFLLFVSVFYLMKYTINTKHRVCVCWVILSANALAEHGTLQEEKYSSITFSGKSVRGTLNRTMDQIFLIYLISNILNPLLPGHGVGLQGSCRYALPGQ